MGCRLASGHHLGVGLDGEGSKAAVIEEDDFAIVVGDQIGKRQLDPGGLGPDRLDDVFPVIHSDAREVADQVCQIGPRIGGFGVQVMIPVSNVEPVIAHFFSGGQGEVNETVRTS